MSNLRKKLEGKKSKLSTSGKIEDHPVKQLYDHGDFKIIPLELIKPDPDQPRKVFNEDALEELSNSIVSNGVLQPIIVRVDESNNIWLIAGERRYRASKKAGLEEIPAIISKGKPAEIALIENIQREDLNPIEEAQAYQRMIDTFNYTQEQLSKIVGKGRSTIVETLSINKLPDQIKSECLNSDIPKRSLVEIVKAKKKDDMFKLFDSLKAGLYNKEILREKRNKKPVKSKAKTLILKEQLIKKIDAALKEFKKSNINLLNDHEKIEVLNKYGEFKEFVDDLFT